MTVYNRKITTINCLKKLFMQEGIDNDCLTIYLVDDGEDGTGDSVKTLFPETIILRGNGDLFWCGGMRLGFSEALKGGYNYYLWLNDDSLLYPNALKTLIDTSHDLFREKGSPSIVVGSMQDPETNSLTYGGRRLSNSLWQTLSSTLVVPSDLPQICDLINGNCVLIPAKIAKSVGNIRDCFMHAAGDYDYGLRAKTFGFSCWVAPGYVGACKQNPAADLPQSKNIPKGQVGEMNSVVAQKRVYDWMLLSKSYGGFMWPIYWLLGTIRIRWPVMWLKWRTMRAMISKVWLILTCSPIG